MDSGTNETGSGIGAGGPGLAPVGFAVAGLGGFAGEIASMLRGGVHEGGVMPAPGCRLVSVGDPAADAPAMAERRAGLEAAGVVVTRDAAGAWAQPGVEGVWLPLPIQLHRPFAESAFTAG
ncbi:MAG: hypothetical protein AAFX76_13225, partial [Planctomycetota bacterium]